MTHVPYGYKIEAGIATFNDDAPAIRKLFTNFIECKSMRAAAKTAGINKTHSVIGRIIKNEIYLGTDFYPQLIDDETFAKAQEVRSTNAKSQNRLGLYRPEKQIPKTFCFKIGKVEKKYDDPYLQAQYTYSQIGEDSNE